METQTTGREKSAYLDSADVLKKKKKKKKKKPTYAPQREKRTLKNGPVEDQNEAQERKLINFLGELSQQQIQPNTEDRCSWKHDQTGYYSTKSGYDLIWEAQMGANQNLDFVDIWKLKIPSKSLVFAWRLIRDKLRTRMNRRRRQVVIIK
ncbi:uncharacterized protein [Glycine max]|uniref:uncharacterized protein n=1 Tax=Glycine max TaxID=3847 RepID=UPI000719410F|nr:uncharacterized protein LOC106794387 [Glycine max]|eukprot:XP_014617140.1 uncharacterized protein LOC106794387 [Glycine max]